MKILKGFIQGFIAIILEPFAVSLIIVILQALIKLL